MDSTMVRGLWEGFRRIFNRMGTDEKAISTEAHNEQHEDHTFSVLRGNVVMVYRNILGVQEHFVYMRLKQGKAVEVVKTKDGLYQAWKFDGEMYFQGGKFEIRRNGRAISL